MAEVQFTIAHKVHTLSCQPGEQTLLKRAAAVLDDEARQIIEQGGRIPEARLLLLAGLVVSDRLNVLEDRLAQAERELQRLKSTPPRGEAVAVPAEVQEAMAILAARAEALADKAEDLL